MDPDGVYIFTAINPLAGSQFTSTGTKPFEWIQTHFQVSEKAGAMLEIKSLRLQKGVWSCMVRPKSHSRLVQGQRISDLFFRIK